jgi:hypothetical protein
MTRQKTLLLLNFTIIGSVETVAPLACHSEERSTCFLLKRNLESKMIPTQCQIELPNDERSATQQTMLCSNAGRLIIQDLFLNTINRENIFKKK